MNWLRRRGRAFVNAALIVMMLILYFTISTPDAKSAISELYQSPVYRGHKKDAVAIECAVSWNAAALTDMLDILRDKGVSITFLLSGEWAKNNAQLLNAIVSDGHELGTMGYDPFEDGDTGFVMEDVQKARDTIHKLSGVKPVLYYSGMRDSTNSSRAAGRLGITHILCTVDALSSRGSAEDILGRALDKPFDGSIILLEPTVEAVKALPACIDGLMQLGYSIIPVGEILAG